MSTPECAHPEVGAPWTRPELEPVYGSMIDHLPTYPERTVLWLDGKPGPLSDATMSKLPCGCFWQESRYLSVQHELAEIKKLDP